jgi:hypothetical protein
MSVVGIARAFGSLAVMAGVVVSVGRADAATTTNVLPSRTDAVVTLTGAQLPAWSRLAATGTPHTYPSGAATGERSAHNGTLVIPTDTRPGAPVDDIVAYRWDPKAARFVEVPVQVDQKFPYFLANPNSNFGLYSGTDTELTYQWDTEAWKMTAGVCA